MSREPESLPSGGPNPAEGAAREERRLEVRVLRNCPEDHERLELETIESWRDLGPEAVWDAIYDALSLWFEARGLDPEAQHVDRTHVEVRRVPWLIPATEGSTDG